MSFATNDVPHLIHTDAGLDATRRRVAGRFLRRGQMLLTKAEWERL
jgi:hypothetical protein